ncbi:hypothetical protein AB6735_03470 [Mucilaginibacter sp. RCC_168]|uniref:hypothetical protein n=1 Tax=Mucilaginibacter sp. RCC_168 TaxID=3239221 RepID=UPI0035243282
MTDLERFNLYWLCQAMTVPVADNSRYCYDGLTRKFFVSKSSALLDMLDLSLPTDEEADLRTRLESIDFEASDIVEIPRLNVQDKVAVQLLFLSKFPGIIHEEKLRLAAEQQPDSGGFVLDKLEKMAGSLAPMQAYWEDFKLQTIRYYLEKYTGIIGIILKML